MSLEIAAFLVAFIASFVWLVIGLLVLWAILKVREHWKEFKSLTPAEIKEAHKIDDDD